MWNEKRKERRKRRKIAEELRDKEDLQELSGVGRVNYRKLWSEKEKGNENSKMKKKELETEEGDLLSNAPVPSPSRNEAEFPTFWRRTVRAFQTHPLCLLNRPIPKLFHLFLIHSRIYIQTDRQNKWDNVLAFCIYSYPYTYMHVCVYSEFVWK